jgi:hypothetical protein
MPKRLLKYVVTVSFRIALHQLDTAKNVFHWAELGWSTFVGSWEAARWYRMGMSFLCMKLSGVREISSNVLKKTSETSKWEAFFLH